MRNPLLASRHRSHFTDTADVKSVLSQLSRRLGPPPISWLMEVALSRPGLISLAAGFTDSVSLPVEDTRRLFDEILRSPKAGRVALQYGSTQGDANLRQLTAERLARLDGAGDGNEPCDDPAYGRVFQGASRDL